MKKYSTEIAQAIQEHLDELEMKLVAFDEANGTFGFVMHLHGKMAFIHYIIKVHEDDYTVMAICPVGPAASDSTILAAMAEFICRANYGLRNGNFEMDFRDGELRYKCFVDCDEQIPSQNVIRDSIGVPAAMMEEYAEGIINVLYKGMDAETAVKECEHGKAVRRMLEEAKRMADRIQDMYSSTDTSEPGRENESVDSNFGASFPSFEEYLSMRESCEDDVESDASTESASKDTSDSDANDFVA